MKMVLAVSVALLAAPAHAGDLDGWCIPDDGCAGEPLPIKDGGFLACEGECRIDNRQNIDGVDADTFRVTCFYDGGDPYVHQTLIGSYIDDHGEIARFMFDENGLKILERCQ